MPTRKKVEHALDDALVRKLTSAEVVLRELRALGTSGRAGTAALVAMLESRVGRPAGDSHLENKLIQLLSRANLPVGEAQVPTTDDRARLIAQVDFAYPEQRLVIQCDGRRWHAGQRRFSQDVETRARLEDFGWQVLNVTFDDVTHRPDMLLERVRQRLKRGASSRFEPDGGPDG